MKHRVLISFFMLIATLVYGVPHMIANDNKPIRLEHDNSSPTSIPKAPAYIPVSCYFDGENIVVASDNSIIGLVTITDAATGSEIASDGGCFNPELVVPLNGFKGYVVITINIGSVTYIGETLI